MSYKQRWMKLTPRHRMGNSTHNCDHSTTDLQMEYQLHHKVVKSEHPNVALCYPAHNIGPVNNWFHLDTPLHFGMDDKCLPWVLITHLQLYSKGFQSAICSRPTNSGAPHTHSLFGMDDKCLPWVLITHLQLYSKGFQSAICSNPINSGAPHTHSLFGMDDKCLPWVLITHLQLYSKGFQRVICSNPTNSGAPLTLSLFSRNGFITRSVNIVRLSFTELNLSTRIEKLNHPSQTKQRHHTNRIHWITDSSPTHHRLCRSLCNQTCCSGGTPSPRGLEARGPPTTPHPPWKLPLRHTRDEDQMMGQRGLKLRFPLLWPQMDRLCLSSGSTKTVYRLYTPKHNRDKK